MTDTTTEAVERLMNDVTPGPWVEVIELDRDGDDDAIALWADIVCVHRCGLGFDGGIDDIIKANARFIAAARDLVPALLADRDRLAALLAASKTPDPVTNADSCQPISIRYTNWRGETATRTIIPRNLWFGSTDWHPEPQWLMTATDVEKCADRDFALSGFAQPTLTYEDGVRAAAAVAYRICAETRHVTLGQKAETSILALIKDKSHE